MTSTEAPPHIITCNVDLAACCERWLTLPFVAMDTEFLRTETYFPIAGLIQVGDGCTSSLIDPLAISDWSPLIALLPAPGVVKLFHACSEHLEAFPPQCGDAPARLSDTQMSAASPGTYFSMSYSRLFSGLLHVDLPNEETRSDWLQRPMSHRQMQDAVDDTQHLAEISTVLAPRLDQ